MPSTYGAGKYGRAAENNAIVVEGLADLQRALRATEVGVEKEVQARIRLIGEEVKRRAAANVQHKTNRHAADGESIEARMGISVVLRGASIYTTAIHGGVQNVGGGPHAGWAARGPHIKRADASHYMDRAVTSSRAFVEQETEAVMDWLQTTFQEA